MGIRNRRWTAAALAGLLLAGGAALAVPEGGKAPAPAARAEKVKRLYQALGYEDLVRTAVKSRIRQMLRGDEKRTEETCGKLKWGSIDEYVIYELDAKVSDRVLDEVLPFLDTPEGKKTLSLIRLDRSLMSLDIMLTVGNDGDEISSMSGGFQKAIEKALEESAPAATADTNEAAAVSTLRNLTSAQAMTQGSGKIDSDVDGIGEFGTFLEMTGAAGVRRGFYDGRPSGSDFQRKGSAINPNILSTALAAVDGNGIVIKKGYCFRIFLPDTGPPSAAGFVHETGPAAAVGLAGGTGRIGVDLAEDYWCAYAWPVQRGVTGTQAFFVSRSGDVMQSANAVAQWSGVEKAPPGNAAFTGPSIVSPTAVGAKGNDGDVWKFTD